MTGDKAIDPEDRLRREPIGKREDVNAEGAKEDAEDAEFKSCSLSRSAPSAVKAELGQRAKSRCVNAVVPAGRGLQSVSPDRPATGEENL
jgi:hypothetical protein